MLRTPLTCLAIMCGVSCGEPPSPPAPVTLRVGASNGLSSFRSRKFSGDTSHAMELVYSLVHEHADVVRLGPTRVSLRPGRSSPFSAAFLCERLLDEAGVTRRRPTPEGCILDFASSEARSSFESYPWLMLDHGPFRVEREIGVDGRAVDTSPSAGDGSIRTVEMASRGDRPGDRGDRADHVQRIQRIHITAMPLHEGWRRLFAHQLDVLPGMSWLYRSHFAGMRSVRTIDIPASAYMHVFFNTRLAEWADPDLRRHIARIIEPDALAVLACGDPVCAVESWRPVPPTRTVEPPPKITILALSSHSSAVTTAQAISYRIRLHHEVEIDVKPLTIETLARMEERSDYALALMPMGILASADRGIIAESLSTAAGYDSPDFIAAAERGDSAEMQRILEHDVPALPLYELRTFAAVDARFCGGQPSNAVSWAWLADLRPCAEERAP
jgi:hypothetical protein